MQVFEKNLLIIKNKCKLGIAIKKTQQIQNNNNKNKPNRIQA